ncbi:MAG: DUF72 domain-containing protein [Leptolinea sp.]|jgi:uncharacterized protein YecE (DUF72 family)|nr:DUF72 domain-containing protein [Leptolinea sp.]
MDFRSPVFIIGTSGWTYDHWKGGFYPVDLAKSRWFDFYAQQFNAVEINATFYRTFADQTYQNWKTRAPQGFGYVLKAPKTITHRKLLRGAEEDIRAFCRSAALLGETFQMILLQVPPNLPYDPGLLHAALQAFPDATRVAVEFRHERWFNPQVEELLSSTGAAFCNVDSPQQRLTEILTSQRAYLRLHGREHWYASDYTAEDLQDVAKRVRRLAGRGVRQVFIFFNNDFGGYAPANALALRKLLDG